MVDYVWPSHIPVAEVEWRLVDLTARSEGTFSGVPRTVSRGQRLACTLQLGTLSAADRSYVIGLMAALRGGANRIWLYDAANRQRGSFSAPELFTNPTFTDGATGWSLQNASLTVSQRRGRVSGTAGIGVAPGITQGPTLTQYAPHVLRSLILDGANSSALSIGRFANLGTGTASDASVARGLGSLAFVPNAASAGSQYAAFISSASGFVLGSTYFDVPYTSLARCALVDGGTNLLTYSDQVDNAAWSASALTVTANNSVSPEGDLTAEDLIPSVASADHYVIRASAATVSNSALDYCICGAFKAAGYNYVRLMLTEGASGTVAYQVFNLNTGAVGTSTFTGANWSNLRAFIVPMGNGWYYCALVVRKTNAATAVTSSILVQNADNASTYAGNGSSGISAWRGTLAQSSVPVRLTQTTTTAISGASQAGTAIYVKGLPASTSGLLLPGDGVEINGERKIVTASLDSNAAGLGYLQFEPAMRTAVADNAPVIIGQPLMKGLLVEDAAWVTRPGTFSDLSLSFVEAA